MRARNRVIGGAVLLVNLTDGNIVWEVIDISQPAERQASWMRLEAAEIGAARRFGDHETTWGNRVNAERWNIEMLPESLRTELQLG